MKKEILIGIIAVLVFVLVLQAAYIVSLKRADNLKQVMIGRRSIKPLQQPASRMQRPEFALEKPGVITGGMPDPFEQVQDMQRRMQRAMLDNNNRFNRPGLQPAGLSLNLSESDTAYLINADMPGMKKEDIVIEVKGDFIVISGERKSEQKVENDNYYLQEISAGKFSRALALPQNIKKNEITSEYNNGVLSIKIPKQAPVKQAEAPNIKVPVK
jgi:HSP20 family protein